MKSIDSGVIPEILLAVLTLLAALPGDAVARTEGLLFERGGHAVIPFDLRSNHIWIRGTVNGPDSIWIALDSGAGSSVLDDSLARRLSLRRSGQHEAMGAGGPQQGSSAEDVTIGLAGLKLHRPHVDTIDLAAISATGGRPMQLILGFELFQSCLVRFDYAAGVMDVWDAATAPRDIPGEALPITLIENLPYVEGTLIVRGRPPLSGRFVIDTGSALALLVAPDVVERESLATAFPRTLVTMGRGVGGEVRNRVGRAESFALGSLRFSGPIVVMPDAGAGRIAVPGAIGNIGGQVLSRGRVTFDYPHQRILFEPVAGFERPFEAEMLGAALTRAEGGLVVRWVNPQTPAADAGLQAGDLVTTLDGEAAERLDPAMLRRRLQEVGRVLKLEVRHGPDSRRVTLTLRRLL
jgi:hypothetical protein